MYFVVVILLLRILPVASVALEALWTRGSLDLLFLTSKWFVFWGVGMRLFIAGVRQAIQPRFTAEEIFGLAGSASFALVRELGFANLSIGLLGMCSLLRSGWIVPAAIAGVRVLLPSWCPLSGTPGTEF